ncbi:hypothetical protein BH11MYX3_BH11MYX3_28940 [soil metagenome]
MRTVSFVLAVLALGCGKSAEDHSNPGSTTAPEKTEAAPPPKEAYKGKNRLLNLFVDKTGKTQPLEVWVRRGFKWGPVKLAESVPFGAASPWFGIPEHMSPVVLPKGAKPDDKEISPMGYGTADEVVTGLVMSSDGVPTVVTMYDVSKTMTQAPKPPAPGMGAVIVFAYQLRDFDKAMSASFGGSAFNVGDGAGACRPQRDPKMAGNALGGTSPYELDLPPGKAKITFHKWPAPKDTACASPAVFEVEVEFVADHSQWVFLYTPDLGKTMKSISLPIGE